MHKLILEQLVKDVKTRAAEGDCPVTPAYSVETLENAVIELADERDRLLKNDDMPLSLEKQYAETLGRLAARCDIVCPWVLAIVNIDAEAPDIKAAAEEIMDYVDAVRP